MKYRFKQLNFETTGNMVTYFQIKDECIDFVKESGVQNGLLVVQSPHTTCSVFFEEYVHDEDALGHEYLQYDLNKGLEKLYPKQSTYDDYYKYPGPKHREFSKTISDSIITNPACLLNGDAHCKATILGSDKVFIINEGKLQTGRFGYIYFVDFDGNRARKRHCNLAIIGE